MGWALGTHARDEKCVLNLRWKAWREDTTWKTKTWMGGTKKHSLHALTVMTSELLHLLLLKTFSVEIQIGVTLLPSLKVAGTLSLVQTHYVCVVLLPPFVYSILLRTLVNEGHLESKERFAIQRYLLIIGKKKNMQVLWHTFTYFST